MKIDKVAERQAEQKKLAIALAKGLYHYKWVASGVGISEKTIHDWKNNDEDFVSQLLQARADFIYNNMRRAKPEFLLQTADRETFGMKQDITTDSKPVTYNIIGSYPKPQFRTDND
jgi:hypothetical protein